MKFTLFGFEFKVLKPIPRFNIFSILMVWDDGGDNGFTFSWDTTYKHFRFNYQWKGAGRFLFGEHI